MSDTAPSPFPIPSADLDSVDHTDDDSAVGAAAVSPAAPAPGPADTRSEAEQALAPAPVDDPGPATPPTADDAVAPDTGAAPAPQAPSPAPAASTPANPPPQPAEPLHGVEKAVEHDVLAVLGEMVKVLVRIEEKIDGVVDDVGTAKDGLAEFAEKAPGMLGGLKHIFGGS